MKRWPLHKTYFWETAPFFRLLLPIIAGILFYSSGLLKKQLSISIVLYIIALSFFIYVIINILKNKNLQSALNLLLINISLLCIAWCLCWLSDIRNSTYWFGNTTNTADAYMARITTIPAAKEKTWKLEVAVFNSLQGNKLSPAKGNAFIYVYKNNSGFPLYRGDTVWIPNKWKVIKNSGNPFEFDYAAYCARNNLFYQQFLSPSDIKLLAKGNRSDETFTEKAHEYCMLQMERYIPDTSAKNLIQAMLLGDEIYLDQNLLNAYSETGIVHIIAISGSNVTIFFFGISFLLWWLKNKKYTWVKYVIALPLVWLYVMMAGAPPSAIRAAIMFSILALGFVMQKNNNSLNQLFGTAVILLCAEPIWLYSIGFQLSFIAVLSLILFYKPIYKLYTPTNIVLKNLWETASASVAAEMLVAPLVVYYFHMFPLMFIVANVAAFLFMGLVSVLGMLIVSFGFIPFIAKIFGLTASILVIYFNKVIYWLQDLNPVSLHFLRLNAAELLFIYISIGSIAVFLIKKKNPAVFAGIASLCCLLIFLCYDEWLTLHQRKIVVYNMSKMNHIELLQGKYFSVLVTDTTLSTNKKEYATKPAHIHWNTWRNTEMPLQEIFLIGNKKALLLNGIVKTEDQFHVDYLILNCVSKKLSLHQLMHTFSPEMILIGNNYTHFAIDRYFEKSKEQNIPVHTLSYDGAYVISSYP
jgi:competence protein ComEC